MKYDPLYHQWRDPSGATPNPTGDDVRRILALPRNLNLALPFLFTPREIEWHRLLVKYSHGQKLEMYEDADARSAGMPLDEHGHEVLEWAIGVARQSAYFFNMIKCFVFLCVLLVVCIPGMARKLPVNLSMSSGANPSARR